MWNLKAEDLSWREQNLLKRLAAVRSQLADRGEIPIDEAVMLVGIPEDDPRWMEQAILRKLAEVRADMAASAHDGAKATELTSAPPPAAPPAPRSDALVREAIRALVPIRRT